MNSSFSGYSLTDFKNIKKPKHLHLTKGLIVNYHYGFNIEYFKSVLEKAMIVNSLLGDIQLPLRNQSEGKGFLQASLYMYPSQFK